MRIREWLEILPQYLMLFPAVLSCYLPMRNQMRYTPARTAGLCLGVLIPFTLAGAWAQAAFRLQANAVFLPALPVFFLLYRRTVTTDLPRILAVYVGVCAMQTFPAQMANALDAQLHPLTWAEQFSVEAALLQSGLGGLMVAAAFLVRRQIRWIIDNLDFAKIWYSTAALSMVFLTLNMAAVPNALDMYYAGKPFHLFPLLEMCALALLVCVYVLFYQGARLMLERAQLDQRTQLLEMQSHQYQALREHMRQTARLRHDFRHSLCLLSALAEQGDMEGIRSHLTEYERGLAKRVPVSYCANATLNALFGYYEEMAASAQIETDWKIELPDPMTVSELDLASLFGNLLEHGIKGCQTLRSGERRFSLTTELRQGNSLYIVSTNSFDGHVRKGENGYCSTRHDGRGIGLASIAVVAEKYNGSARFSNSDTEFFVDVVLKV